MSFPFPGSYEWNSNEHGQETVWELDVRIFEYYTVV